MGPVCCTELCYRIPHRAQPPPARPPARRPAAPKQKTYPRARAAGQHLPCAWPPSTTHVRAGAHMSVHCGCANGGFPHRRAESFFQGALTQCLHVHGVRAPRLGVWRTKTPPTKCHAARHPVANPRHTFPCTGPAVRGGWVSRSTTTPPRCQVGPRFVGKNAVGNRRSSFPSTAWALPGGSRAEHCSAVVPVCPHEPWPTRLSCFRRTMRATLLGPCLGPPRSKTTPPRWQLSP